MLIAENELKERLSLVNLTHAEIETFRQTVWFCPGCKEEVQIKNGQIKRPHFSHKSKKACDTFSENESEEHLIGKQLIADNCETFGNHYELEAYLSELKQQPDLLINKKIAIEFQCSPLSSERFKERTINYQKHDYFVIWVVGKHFFLKEKSRLLQKHFMYYSSDLGFYYWELDVSKNSVTLKYFIQLISGKLRFKSISWSLKKTNLATIWQFIHEKKTKEYWLMEQPDYHNQQLDKWNQKLNRKEPQAMSLQLFFYQHGSNLRLLSPFTSYPSFLTPLLAEKEWQLRFLVQTFFCIEKKGTFTDIYSYVEEKKTTDWPIYPLVDNQKLIVYCLSFYLSFLLKTKKIYQQKKVYYFNQELCCCPKIEAEILWLPLKYVMINK